MRPTSRAPLAAPIRVTRLLCACLLLPVAGFGSQGHGGLPAPSVELTSEETTVPFVLPERFPVPVVEVMLNGDGPWRLAVDTAMGGTVLLRRELAAAMGLPVVGRAMVGDSSGAELKPADLVRIDEMSLGGLTVRDIVGLGFSAGNAHLADIPDDLHGILGNQIYAELLTTLDYPGRRITFERGSLGADDPSTVEFEDEGRVMAVDLEVAGLTVRATVDSGHRGTITLPRSLASELPLAGETRELQSLSTVSSTYQRDAARLDGEAVLAGIRMLGPEIVFADEPTPRLIGFGVLEHLVLTIDQVARRMRLRAGSGVPIEGIRVVR